MMRQSARRATSQWRRLASVSSENPKHSADSTVSAAATKQTARGNGVNSSKKSTSSSLDALKGISLLADAHSQRIAIDASFVSVSEAIGPNSFTVSGVRVHGSLLLLPHLATFWNVNTMEDVCDDAFALVKLHSPRPDMLLLGTGATVQPVPREIYSYFRKLGVRFDVLDTKNACQTFNVLNEEGRLVAAALLPESTRPLIQNG